MLLAKLWPITCQTNRVSSFSLIACTKSVPYFLALNPGSVRYRIRVSASPTAEIRERYEAAVKKQKFIFELPSGVNLSDMAELWQQLDYGSEDKPPAAFDPASFRDPSASTLRTRRLAQRGNEHLKRIAQEDEGKPVHVYTMPGSDASSSKNPAESA